MKIYAEILNLHGCVVSAKGISPTEENIEAINQTASPENPN